MKKNYYEEVIEKIDSLIKENKKEQALSIIKEELSIPYIPRIYEEKFKFFLEILETKREKNNGYFSKDELITIMFEFSKYSIDFILSVASSFDMYNWNSYENEIEKILNFDNLNSKAKSIIYNNLVIQNINYNFFIKKENVYINPLKNKTTFETIFCLKNMELIKSKIINNPSLSNICEKVFFIYILSIFPNSFFMKFKDISNEIIKISEVMIGEKKIEELNEFEVEIYNVIKGES